MMDVLLAICSLLVVLLVGCLFLLAIRAGWIGRFSLPLFISSAFLTGASLLSCMSAMAAMAHLRWNGWVLEAMVCATLIGILMIRRILILQPTYEDSPRALPTKTLLPTWIQLALVMTIALSVVSLACQFISEPYGVGDAYTQWYLKARFIYYTHGDLAFLGDNAMPQWIHPDYPLFLPFAVVRIWRYMGSATPIGTAFFQSAVYVAFLIAVFSMLSAIRSPFHGGMAVIALVGTPVFIEYLGYQYADPAFTAYLSVGMLLLIMYYEEWASTAHAYSLMVLGSFIFSSSIWIKNEGASIVGLLLLFVLARSFVARSRVVLAELGSVIIGAVVPIAIRIIFAMLGGGESDLFVERISVVRAVHRLPAVIAILAKDVWPFSAFGALMVVFVYVALAKKHWLQPSSNCLAATLLLGQTACYIAAYAITPHELTWHIHTTSSRLFTHILVPAMIVLLANTSSSLVRERNQIGLKILGSLNLKI